MGLFSISTFLPLLFLSIYGLRLFGQGLMSHTAITSMARFFDKDRGKAISIANLGHPIGEAILPILIVSVMFFVGWRYTLVTTLVLVLLSLPLAIYLLRKNSNFSQLRKYIPQPFNKKEEQQARPLQVMKTKAFWIIMPSSLAAASVGTGFLLFKLKLGLSNDWTPTFIAAGFTAYAIGNALSNLLAGFLSDRFSGKVLYPFYLIPACLGLLSLMLSTDPWVYIALFAGIGITNGFGSTVKNVALAELYGTRIIGSFRSLFSTVMVFWTALGPLAFGILLDKGYSFQSIAFFSLVLYLVFTVNAVRIWRMK
jgi:MFS family permease